MDDPYQSFNEGRFGQAPSANTNWDEYNKGASVRAWNQAELDRQQQSVADSFSSASTAPTLPAGGGTTFGGFGGAGSFAGGGGLVNAAGPAGCLLLAGAFLMSPVVLPLWAGLYPLAATAAVASAGAAFAVLGAVAPSIDPRSRLVAAVVVLLVVLWPASRLDHRLAKHSAYRGARHVLRLAVAGAYAWWLSIALQGTDRFPPSMHLLQHLFGTPTRFAVVLGAVAAAHVLLIKGTGARAIWHSALGGLKLRPE